jgi:hypothetical protein
LNAAGDGHLLAGLEAADGLEVAAILIADREAIEKIFNGGKADPLKIRRAFWPNTFQKLQGGL